MIEVKRCTIYLVKDGNLTPVGMSDEITEENPVTLPDLLHNDTIEKGNRLFVPMRGAATAAGMIEISKERMQDLFPNKNITFTRNISRG